MKISGNTVLITGGCSGIGKIMGRMALEKGAKALVIWDINEAAVAAVAEEFKPLGKVYGFRADISSPESVDAAYRATKASCGDVDILVNCAGIITNNKVFAEQTDADINRTFDINTKGAMFVTLRFLKDMRSRGRGHICNITSSAGMLALPKMSLYASSKWAAIGWSESLRIELQREKSPVRVTTIAPYFINTGMFDGIRSFFKIQDPEVVARARDNIAKAGLTDLIQVEVCDIRSLRNPFPEAEPGVLFCNPPYGERLGNFAELLELYTSLGNKIRSEFPGWRAGIISSSQDLLSCLRLRAERTYRLFNGAIPCELRTFAIRREEPIQENGEKGEHGKNGEPDKLPEQAPDEAALKTPEKAPVELSRESPDSGEKAIIAADFANRLRKNLKRLSKWARREGLEAYRIYDADLPDYAAAIDLYGNYVLVQEYQAPKTIPVNVAHRRLLNMIAAVAEVLDVPGENIVLKVRERKKGDSQYEKLSETKRTLLIREYGCCFIVNLWDYLDTGLFLDHRLARRMVGEMSPGRDVLNVFAYTGSASVYAAVNGARSVTTVDMSRTYLNWARENMKANGVKNPRNQFVQADCLKWIKTCGDRFDLIFADPPTFSNSRRMEESFDVQRDHADLLRDLKRLLKPHGVIIFSNNKRNFHLDTAAVAALGLTFEDVSLKTLPEDFSRNKKIHCCFVLREAAPGDSAPAGKTGVPSGASASQNREEPA